MVVPKNGYRDEELFVSKEVFQDHGFKADIASSSLGKCSGMLGQDIYAEFTMDSIIIDDYVAVVFIGGIGAKEYWNNKKAHKIAVEAYKKGKVLAAICTAPVTLANAGLLKGKKSAVSEFLKDKIERKGAIYTIRGVEADGNIVTSSGPASSEGFAYKVIELLTTDP
ncbi:MAG: DJ-1/PfpI family protein [Candidatus Omnitrophica bacterium]|nr:DJ-1/PfpI family protein [Candidatus Omnitrophota bacterium]